LYTLYSLFSAEAEKMERLWKAAALIGEQRFGPELTRKTYRQTAGRIYDAVLAD
jgi:hypothetical protein